MAAASDPAPDLLPRRRPRITAIRPTTVAVPLEAPLRHAAGAHRGRFVRSVVEVDTDLGITGLGEMGGGGESAEAAFRGLEPYLVGHDPFDLEALRFKIRNPTASLYDNRTQLHAAIAFACLDIMGKHVGLPVHDLLAGRLRDAVPFASYLFFRLPNDQGKGEVRTADQLLDHARALKAARGFTSHKLKGGVFPPPTTSLASTGRWPRSFPATASATIPTPPSRSRKRSASAAPSRTSTTTTSRIRPSA